MPEAVAAFVADAVAAYLGDAVFAAVYYATEIAVTLAISAAASYALAPKPPALGSIQTPIKQSYPARVSGYGRTRVSGPYMLFEAANGVLSIVIAFHDGRVDGWERYFLHDDEVEINGPGGGIWCPKDPEKYAYGTSPGDRTFIATTLGLPTETAFPRPINDAPGLWSASHRGDGIAAGSLTAKQSKQKFQNKDFPNGVPQLSMVGRLQRVYDPRAGQDQTDPDTYAWSQNLPLILMSFLTNGSGGMGLSFSRRIAPSVDFWIRAANDADREMLLLSGETEPRYAGGGVYQWITSPVDVINQVLQGFDGFLAQRGDGSLIVRSGVYEPPTVTLTDDHITASSIEHFRPDEESVNELAVSYTDPNTLYNEADAGAWSDEADIAARGMRRSEPLKLAWVQSPSQARRLAKRKLKRMTAELRGSLTTNLYGMVALGERYLRVRSSEPALADVVIEVLNVRIDLASLSLTFDWVQADPDIDAWDRFSEEKPATAPPARPDVPLLTAPTITDAVPFYETSAADTLGARLRITVTSPIEADVEWLVRWRVVGSTNWNEGAYSDIDDGASVELETGFVSADVSLEVQAAYVTAGGTSPWSATFTVPVPVAGITAFLDEAGDAFLDETGLRFYEET